jgi:hypothetical protein
MRVFQKSTPRSRNRRDSAINGCIAVPQWANCATSTSVRECCAHRSAVGRTQQPLAIRPALRENPDCAPARGTCASETTAFRAEQRRLPRHTSALPPSMRRRRLRAVSLAPF